MKIKPVIAFANMCAFMSIGRCPAFAEDAPLSAQSEEGEPRRYYIPDGGRLLEFYELQFHAMNIDRGLYAWAIAAFPTHYSGFIGCVYGNGNSKALRFRPYDQMSVMPGTSDLLHVYGQMNQGTVRSSTANQFGQSIARLVECRSRGESELIAFRPSFVAALKEYDLHVAERYGRCGLRTDADGIDVFTEGMAERIVGGECRRFGKAGYEGVDRMLGERKIVMAMVGAVSVPGEESVNLGYFRDPPIQMDLETLSHPLRMTVYAKGNDAVVVVDGVAWLLREDKSAEFPGLCRSVSMDVEISGLDESVASVDWRRGCMGCANVRKRQPLSCFAFNEEWEDLVSGCICIR